MKQFLLILSPILLLVLSLIEDSDAAEQNTLFTQYNYAEHSLNPDIGLTLYRNNDYCDINVISKEVVEPSANRTYFYMYLERDYKNNPNPDWLDLNVPNGSGNDQLIMHNLFHGYNFTFWMELGTNMASQEWKMNNLFYYINPIAIYYKFNDDFSITATMYDEDQNMDPTDTLTECNEQSRTIRAPSWGSSQESEKKSFQCSQYSLQKKYAFHYSIKVEFQVTTQTYSICETTTQQPVQPSGPGTKNEKYQTYKIRTSILLHSILNNPSSAYDNLPYNLTPHHKCIRFDGEICQCIAKFEAPKTEYEFCNELSTNTNLAFCIYSTIHDDEVICNMCEKGYQLTNSNEGGYCFKAGLCNSDCAYCSERGCLLCNKDCLWDNIENICSCDIDDGGITATAQLNEIENCEIYYSTNGAQSITGTDTNSLCYQCSDNYVASFDQTMCLITMAPMGCRILNMAMNACFECKADYEATYGNSYCIKPTLDLGYAQSYFYFKIIDGYQHKLRQIYDQDNTQFFMRAEMNTNMVSFSKLCGWGNEAYWIRDQTESTKLCNICPKGTVIDYLGDCNCINSGYGKGLISTEHINATFITRLGITVPAFIFKSNCYTESELLIENDLSCYSLLSTTLIPSNTNMKVEAVYNQPTSTFDTTNVIMSLEVFNKNNLSKLTKLSCFGRVEYFIFQWHYSANLYGYYPYPILYYVNGGSGGTNNFNLITLQANNYSYEVFLFSDLTDPFHMYKSSIYLFQAYTIFTDFRILGGKIVDKALFPVIELSMTSLQSTYIRESAQSQYQTYFSVYDWFDFSYQECYGCMLQYENSFLAGRFFHARLCFDELCKQDLLHYRQNLFQVVYAGLVPLERFQVRNTRLPVEVRCSIRPNSYLGLNNIVESRYNTELGTSECEIKEKMWNNLKGYLVKMTLWKIGRIKYQIDLIYSEADQAEGVKNQKIYYEFFVNNDWKSRTFLEDFQNSSTQVLYVITFIIVSLVMICSCCKYYYMISVRNITFYD